MIFVQLINEPSVWRGGRTPGPNELEGLCRGKTVNGDEIAAYNSDRAAGAHRTVDEDARIRTRAQRARYVSRRVREVPRELRERRIVQGYLRCVCGQRWGERDVPRHSG